MRRILLLSLVLVACASHRPTTPVSVNVVPGGIPIIRGYQFNDVEELLKQAIEGTVVATSEAYLTVRVEPGTFVTPELLSPSFNDASQNVKPDIVWFNVNYTIRNAIGDEKSGTVSAYGPEPIGFENFQQQRLSVVRNAAVRLREATASF